MAEALIWLVVIAGALAVIGAAAGRRRGDA
jgi:hypothetical protein